MKKIVFGLFALTMAFSSMAQTVDKKPGEQKDFHKEHKRFKADGNFEKLNLTEDQKAQVKTLNEDFRQQMKDLNKQGNITVNEQRTKRKALMQEHRQKMDAILTPEQRKQAESFKKAFAGRRGQGEGRFNELTKDLNLSADQSSKMAALNSDLKTKLQAIRQNSTLSENEKKEQLKSLMKKHRTEMEALLSAEQKEQLKLKLKERNQRSGGISAVK